MDTNQIISLLFRIISLVVLIFGVFPRAWKEIKVKDGIKKLRWFIFWGIAAFFIVDLSLTHMNFCNLMDCWSIGITGKTGVIQAFGFLNVSLVLLLIYHQKYK